MKGYCFDSIVSVASMKLHGFTDKEIEKELGISDRIIRKCKTSSKYQRIFDQLSELRVEAEAKRMHAYLMSQDSLKDARDRFGFTEHENGV